MKLTCIDDFYARLDFGRNSTQVDIAFLLPGRAVVSTVEWAIFKPIWLGNERPKALIFKNAGCDRP
jgi:hypothetical protein